MLDARHIIIPEDSEAVSRLEWDSGNSVLYATYVSGDRVYAFDETFYTDFVELCNLAHEHGSWGRALHRWKVGRVVTYEERDREVFDALVQNLHPETIRRFSEYFSEAASAL